MVKCRNICRVIVREVVVSSKGTQTHMAPIDCLFFNIMVTKLNKKIDNSIKKSYHKKIFTIYMFYSTLYFTIQNLMIPKDSNGINVIALWEFKVKTLKHSCNYHH